MPSPARLRPASEALADHRLADPALARPERFEAVRAAAARAPLTEIAPARPGDETAALGFALAWLAAAPPPGLIVWIASDRMDPELGLPHAEGLAQFGLTLDRLLVVRPRTLEETLWAAEEAVSAPGVAVLAALPPARRPLGLAPSRRLLLRAEQRATRAVLLRLDPRGATAAWTRWTIAPAASDAACAELGPPVWRARLDRNRAGPIGSQWTVAWRAPFQDFIDAPRSADDAVAGALAPASADRPAAADRARAA